MYRANYPVDNPSDYWKLSIYIVLLNHSMEEISKEVVNNVNEECYFGIFYLSPASLLNLILEIIDRLFNAYRTDLPRKVDFVSEVGRSGGLL